MDINEEKITDIIAKLTGLKVLICGLSEFMPFPAKILKSSIKAKKVWLLFDDGFVSGQSEQSCKKYREFSNGENILHEKVKVRFPELYFQLPDNSVISALSCCWFVHPESKEEVTEIFHKIITERM